MMVVKMRLTTSRDDESVNLEV